MAEITFQDVTIPIGEADDPLFTFAASGTFEVDDEGYVETITLEGWDAYDDATSKTFFVDRMKARNGLFDHRLICVLADQLELTMKDAIEESLIDLHESRADGPEYEPAE